MKKLSNPRQQIYDFLLVYTTEHDYPPTIREIGDAVGLTSTATVHNHLKNLEKAGLIERDATKQRTIRIVRSSKTRNNTNVTFDSSLDTDSENIPLVGRIAAGTPILAEENIEDAFPLPFYMTRGKHAPDVYMLRVCGESMMNAGIRDGDIIVVNRDTDYSDGDIVVACVAGESATVKRLYREENCIRLQPENPNFSPILVPYESVSLDGKVIGLLRTM